MKPRSVGFLITLLCASLAAMGYTNVRDYAEGKQHWIEAGLPVESDHRY